MEKVLSIEQTNRALQRKRTNEKLKKIFANVFIYFVILLMYAPIIYITVYSFSEGTTGVWTGFSINNYTTLFDLGSNDYAKKIWGAAGNTALVALTAATVSTILGTLGAIGIYYSRKKWIKPKLAQMDPSLYEAAMDLGATQTQALWKVIIPDIIPGILSGFMLSVTLSLDDYVITAFSKPTVGGFETISTYVDAVTVKKPLPAQLRAFTAILFAVILIVMIVMNIKSSQNSKKLIKKEKNKNA